VTDVTGPTDIPLCTHARARKWLTQTPVTSVTNGRDAERIWPRFFLSKHKRGGGGSFDCLG
jgi:hypothetical protein